MCAWCYAAHGDQTTLITHVEHVGAMTEDLSRRCAGTIVLPNNIPIPSTGHACGNGAHEGPSTTCGRHR